ncbi:hypothetical protein BJV74DRAFT_546454 [Russula compacta]|nr:hypothetical protein BJV74DRAFT_546454 [Russula compacta]
MDATAPNTIYGSSNHPYAHRHRVSNSNSLTSSSSTLINPAYPTRPSIKLRISCGSSNILNSEVVDESGRPLYSITSNSKRTTLVSCKDNVEVAAVDWDRANPRVVFREKKMKCKDWLSLAGPETNFRTFTHGDAQLTWVEQSTSGHLIHANRPGLALARWHINSYTDELHLEIFHEALVEHRLLEAIILSLLLLRSGRSLGEQVELVYGGKLWVHRLV